MNEVPPRFLKLSPRISVELVEKKKIKTNLLRFISTVDNTAWILTRRGGWSLRGHTLFHLPVCVSDGERSSTSTLTVRVCGCDHQGNVLSCNAEAYSLPASLSRGALIAILACILVLLGEWGPQWSLPATV